MSSCFANPYFLCPLFVVYTHTGKFQVPSGFVRDATSLANNGLGERNHVWSHKGSSGTYDASRKRKIGALSSRESGGRSKKSSHLILPIQEGFL